jgi:hypothetical protein
VSNSISILRRFIYRGGLIGSIAQMYVDDEAQAEEFALELAHQLKTNKERLIGEWGIELIEDLEILAKNKCHRDQKVSNFI